MSYKNSQTVVNNLANQLLSEVGNRIDQNLSNYMQDIERITQTNAFLVQTDMLTLADQVPLRKHFWQQLHTYQLASTVALATEKRDFMALERDSISYILREYDKNTRLYASYRLNEDGEKTKRTGIIENYDPLNDPPHDPWYSKTKARKESLWLIVVTMAKGPDAPELMIVNFRPVFDRQHKDVLGVAASSIYLSTFGQFLKSLKIGQNGQAFVISKQGELIATSTGELPFRRAVGKSYPETMVTESSRMAAIDSRNSVTRASMRAIVEQNRSLSDFDRSRCFNLNVEGARYLGQIIPLKKGNLDWLTVIVVPETDFMGDINKNVRNNLLFSILALMVALAIGVVVVRGVTNPILRLNAAAKRMAQGEWDKTVTIDRSDEIGELAGTFNDMAMKLKSSFENLHEEIGERKRMEETIRGSEERFRRLIENVPAIAIQGYSLDGATTYWNHASELLYGYTAEEAVGRNLLDLIIPDEMKAEVGNSIRQMLETDRPIPSSEMSLKRKDGSRVSVFSNHALVHLPGSPQELFCLDIDLTERKRAEEQLLFSEFSVEHSGITTMWLDKEGRVVRVNDAACRSLGYDRNELLSMTVRDFDPNFQSLNKWHRGWEGMKKNRYTVIETLHQCKDGSIFPVAVVTSFFDYTGEEYLVSFAHDITSRKRTEEEILREREKLQILSDHAPFGMALIDDRGRFTYVNTQFSQLFGFDLTEIPDGRTFCRNVYPNREYRQTVISTWIDDMKEAKAGEQKLRTFTVTSKDGTQKFVQFIFSLLASKGYLMTCEDITTMRELESQLRQAQKMEAVGTLAGGIAHDFNNILTALMGYASLIKMQMEASSPLQPYVNEVLSASQKAADLTRGLLTFSRQQTVSLIPLDINDAVKSTEKLLRRLLPEDIELSISFSSQDLIILADRSQIDQIVFNLTANARDAMPKGGTLRIETDSAMIDGGFIQVHGFGKPGHYAVITIADTGTGMDESTQEKIFDPFFTTKEVGKGTGLGLATVYGIVKQHNGYITLDSAPDQGATFRIYLPTIQVKIEQEQNDLTSLSGGKETILIAEDNVEVMGFMRDALRGCGYNILEASDGDQAINLFKNRMDADLVILDSVMPKKNGREVYDEIRRMSPNIKVLFTSGYTRDMVLEKGIEEKAFNFIAKPLSLTKLLEKVRQVLDKP